MSEPLKISTGSRVAVVGGGPAGSFFSLYLLQYGAQSGITPQITIYQQHDFCELGPRGCKGCAGILSLSLLKNLPELGLSVPDEIVRSKIDQYTVHSPYTSITISNPEKDVQVVSVYRGGGPRQFDKATPVSFDNWLLRQAERRGARILLQPVSRIILGERPAIEVAGDRFEYDLIVLATGVRPVPVDGLDYVPPRTQTMAQDELYAGQDHVQTRLGSTAHAFLLPHSRIIFGTLVPKGSFINVSVLSNDRDPVSVADFLQNSMVREVLPEHVRSVCGCRPKAALSAARNYYWDRFVAVGDAAVTRLYKDGIGSALLTAREAARTAVLHGIARQDFARHYHPFCMRIDRSNRWGKILFSLNDAIKNSRVFLLAQQRLIGDEQSNARGPQPFTRAAWGMFTGSYSYGSIAGMVFHPAALLRLGVALTLETWRSLFRRGVPGPRKLHVGSKKVLILGSGFGGTYVLRHLVPALNRNENVETTLVSEENHFLFTPLLHEVAMGRIEGRHIAYPIRRLHWRDRFSFIQASVEKIELSHRRVITNSGTFNYDYLVMALGSVPNRGGLSLSGDNVFTFKTLRDAILLRNHIIGVFEQAMRERVSERRRQWLTFIVAGAGYTGVQFVTELRDYLQRNLLRFYRAISPADIRIILVEAEPKIIADLHTRLGAYTMRLLQRMGIDVRLKSRVTGLGEDYVEVNGTERISMGTLIWVAGVVPSPRIAEADAPKDSMGRVIVNEFLEVPGFPGVYALGDCAHFGDRSGKPVPPRAHIAVRQARVVAHNVLAEIRGRDKKPYRYSYGPEVVSLGSSSAVFRFHNLRIYGLPARLIWLAAYSLLVTGKNNRLRILMDWLLSLVFGRDTVYIRLVGETRENEPGGDNFTI